MSRVCVSTELSSNGAVISIGLRFVAITNMNAKYFFATNWLIRFRVSRRRREMYFGYARLRVCVCVCLSVRGRMPTLLHGPKCNLREW